MKTDQRVIQQSGSLCTPPIFRGRLPTPERSRRLYVALMPGSMQNRESGLRSTPPLSSSVTLKNACGRRCPGCSFPSVLSCEQPLEALLSVA